MDICVLQYIMRGEIWMRHLYIDMFIFRAIIELTMDYLLLWATAEITHLKTTKLRLFLGALAGTSYSIVVFLQRHEVISGYQYGGDIIFKIILSLAMLGIVFMPISLRRFINAMGIFYLIAFMSGGAALATVYLTEGNWLIVNVVAMGTILIVAELGWGIVQKKIWQEMFFVPIEIQFGNKTVKVNALVDTGNRLKDPLTGTPVVIVESSVMVDVLPRELNDLINLSEGSDLTEISAKLAGSTWSSRFRIIPYASIGKDRGLLIGFRPTMVRVKEDKYFTETRNCIVGIHNRKLCPEGTYKALLHPEIFQSVMSEA